MEKKVEARNEIIAELRTQKERLEVCLSFSLPMLESFIVIP